MNAALQFPVSTIHRNTVPEKTIPENEGPPKTQFPVKRILRYAAIFESQAICIAVV